MRILLLIPLLAGCATAPAHLELAKRTVDARMEYVYYRGWVKPAGLTENQGNCVEFSREYAKELRRMGYTAPEPTLCLSPVVRAHAVLDVDGWRLDNMLGWVTRVEDSDCKPIKR